MRRFRKSSPSSSEYYEGQHRFEHWYRDNTVYFINARCRDRTPAFASEQAKAIFWDRFDYYSNQYGFRPWITSLIDNHYHTEGYLKSGENLGQFIRHLHGSVAKLVNDLLPQRLTPFWYETGKQGYFYGCLRNEKQGRKTYRYFCCNRYGTASCGTIAITRTRVSMSIWRPRSRKQMNSTHGWTTSLTSAISVHSGRAT